MMAFCLSRVWRLHEYSVCLLDSLHTQAAEAAMQLSYRCSATQSHDATVTFTVFMHDRVDPSIRILITGN